EEFEKIIIKVDGAGQTVHLRDVALCELEANSAGGTALLDGKRVVGLAVLAAPAAKLSEVHDRLRERLDEVGKRLAEGLNLETPLELAGDKAGRDLLVVELALPAGTSPERVGTALEHSEKLIRDVDGVRQILAFSGDPLEQGSAVPRLLVRLTPDAAARREDI